MCTTTSHGGVMRREDRKQEKTFLMGVAPWAGRRGGGLHQEGQGEAERKGTPGLLACRSGGQRTEFKWDLFGKEHHALFG